MAEDVTPAVDDPYASTDPTVDPNLADLDGTDNPGTVNPGVE